MSTQVHTHRMVVSVALAAIVVAAALPVIAALARENGNEPVGAPAGDAAALVAAVATPAVTTATAYTTTTYKTGDPAHAASMMIVGTLLIGIGSMVRRAA